MRLIALLTLLWILPALVQAQSAHENQGGVKKLTLTLDAHFPFEVNNAETVYRDFNAVAQDVVEVVNRRCAGANFPYTRPIVCYFGTEKVPHTDVENQGKSQRIRMSLTQERVQARDYSKFAFQLGHELGHVVLDARRCNGLVETLADAFSYQVLDDMSDLWKTKYADFPPWRDFAPEFHKYRLRDQQDYLSGPLRSLQAQVQEKRWTEVAAFLKAHQQELDANPYGNWSNALRCLGATAFLARNVSWQDLAGFAGFTDPPPSQAPDYRNGLPIVMERTPKSLHDALRRMGRLP